MGRFLTWASTAMYALLLRPSAIFNLLKLPVMWHFYIDQTADPVAAALFVLFWMLLAFWIARWGTWYFWCSIVLQFAFAGFPDIKTALASDVPDLLDLHTHWSVWLFAAGISLEVLEWTRHAKPSSPVA